MTSPIEPTGGLEPNRGPEPTGELEPIGGFERNAGLGPNRGLEPTGRLEPTGGPAPHGAPAAGFTLIEMLVVLAILGSAAAILLARGPARSPALEARGAASELAQALRLGRSRAIAGDRTVPVVVDLATHRLMVDGASRPALPGSVALAAEMADGSRPARQAAFLFAPDGSASGGRIALGVGSRRLVVTVDWLTGRVGVDGN